MNKIFLMGRITRNLELKTTPNGVPCLQFSIAVDRNFQKKGEEKKTDFFNIVAWRQNAEFIAKWFGKGKLILIEGELQTRQYTDKNGNPATWYEVIVDAAHFTGEKSQGQEPPADLPPEPPQYSAPSGGDGQAPTDDKAQFEQADSDDYPF